MKQAHEANEIVPPAGGLGIPLTHKMIHGERELRHISKHKVENGPSQPFNTSSIKGKEIFKA